MFTIFKKGVENVSSLEKVIGPFQNPSSWSEYAEKCINGLRTEQHLRTKVTSLHFFINARKIQHYIDPTWTFFYSVCGNTFSSRDGRAMAVAYAQRSGGERLCTTLMKIEGNWNRFAVTRKLHDKDHSFFWKSQIVDWLLSNLALCVNSAWLFLQATRS